MPRRVVFHGQSAGDPQTVLQDDKDPMLTLNPDYLDCHSDTDPAGDLGKGSDDPGVNGRSPHAHTERHHAATLSCVNDLQ